MYHRMALCGGSDHVAHERLCGQPWHRVEACLAAAVAAAQMACEIRQAHAGIHARVAGQQVLRFDPRLPAVGATGEPS